MNSLLSGVFFCFLLALLISVFLLDITLARFTGSPRSVMRGATIAIVISILVDLFDQELFPEPKFPENYEFEGKAESAWTDADRSSKALHDAYEAWRKNVDAGRSLSNELNARFAGWYYVISAEMFDKIHRKRADLIKRKES